MEAQKMAAQNNEEIYKNLDQSVTETLALSGNCAQTTFLSLSEQFDLEDDAILKALTPFPGIALRGETCGAVIGCLMVLGLVYGRDKENLNDWQSYLNSLPPSRRFCRQFEKEFGSTMCGDIVETEFGKRFNLADPIEAMEWFNCGAIEKCGEVISKGVHIAADLILETDS
jgi:C_GCAxxG_C_C family probable redox protein